MYIEKSYKRWGIDKTLFIKNLDHGILIAQINVDDIVFGFASLLHVHEFFDNEE